MPPAACPVRRSFAVSALNGLADDPSTPGTVSEALDALARYAVAADVVDAVNVLDAVRLALVDAVTATERLFLEGVAAR